MNINGIWSYELGGVYGWEPIGTLYFKEGEIRGGGRNHYATGKYKAKGKGVVLHIEINQFGEKRALFGQKSDQVHIDIKARGDSDLLTGDASLQKPQTNKAHYSLCIRFKRRAYLPEEKTHKES